ncbi:hypothetical protein QNJ24_00065 [Macrococcus caseolyticus]|uniref:hypothetical protein n=1 Tax=Macrococcoides caseolyticum TaxID=69966 RepID=UPI0024BC34B6|nr:hypothetical protein [Macrococcus caseolyticus]MDJ1154475.1 hypothetical protein [Macrococcus caseolyticus]
MIVENSVFTYKHHGFTKFVEMLDDHWTLKIVSNKDSELIYEGKFYSMNDTHYLNDDVIVALDEYLMTVTDELMQIGSFLLGWRLSE